ncbi:MAG: acyltransferase [Mesorhizobium sp.]|nr:acyltransferase [Mesorhizobium sp.]
MSHNATPHARIATLDLLRLVAALAVVGFHYLFRGAAAEPYLAAGYPEAAPYAIYLYLGVNLFFLISGFVISASAEGRTWQRFAVARFARVYPGFVVCMLLTALVLAVAQTSLMPISARQVLANLVIFAPALGEPFVDGVYWSIVLELVFYGWVALAVAAGVFSRFKLELVTVWLLVCAANEFLLGSGALRLLFLTEYGPLFAGGILMHHVATRGRSAEALLLIAAAFLLSTHNMQIMQAWMIGHYGTAVPLAGLVAANVLMHAMLAAAILLARYVPSTPALIMLGGITYPLYLLHQHIGYVAINALAPAIGPWPAALATTAAMLLLSYAVWRFAERPGQRLALSVLQPLAERLTARLPFGLAGGTR